MAAFQGGAIAIGMALLFSGARGEGRRHGGLMLGASAGLLIGVSDVAIKALAEVVPGSPVAILSPWTLVAAIAASRRPSTHSPARCSSAIRSR